MENEGVPFSVMLRSSAKGGLILGLISVLISVITYVLGPISNTPIWVSVLSYLILLGGAWYFTVNYRNTICEGYISYGKAFTYGWFTIMFAGVISVLFNVLLQTVIDPGYMEKVMEFQREQLYAKGGMSDAQIEQSIEIATKFMTPGFLVFFGLLGSALQGLIVSLISSAFARKERPVFE